MCQTGVDSPRPRAKSRALLEPGNARQHMSILAPIRPCACAPSSNRSGMHITSISASPTPCPLRGYGRAGAQSGRLGELSTGAYHLAERVSACTSMYTSMRVRTHFQAAGVGRVLLGRADAARTRLACQHVGLGVAILPRLDLHRRRACFSWTSRCGTTAALRSDMPSHAAAVDKRCYY